MADQGLDHSVYVARPHRVRVITIIATLALCTLTAIGWFLLPAEIRALFTLSQRLTLLGVLGAARSGDGGSREQLRPRRRDWPSNP